MCKTSCMTTYIVSLRVEICAHKTRLTPPLFIQMPVPSQESDRSCISKCGTGIDSVCVYTIYRLDFVSVSTIYRLDFGTVLMVWYFLVFHVID
jgi:hypothetical protein